MTTFKLVTFHDQPTGTLGLGLKGQQHNEDMFAAFEGALIAHDIVEHPDTHSLDTVESELMALGAVWECRCRWADTNRKRWSSIYSPEQSIAFDYAETFRYFVERDGGYITKPKLTRASHKTSSFDEAIGYMLETAEQYSRDNDIEFTADQLRTFNDAALHYGRMGIRRYLARWGDSLWGNTVFWNIAEAVDRIVKHIEFEGQEFDLHINKKTGRVIIEESYYDY